MRNPLIFVLFFLSGAAGLVYELIWVRELVFVFGGTTYAITTVLVAFMGGLGLGSYISGRLSHRLKQPAHAYAILEIAIGVYALAVPVLLNFAQPIYRAAYPLAADTPWLLTTIRFLVGGLILIVPTTFMGATLPILVRYITLRGGALGTSVGLLYGINTLGAVVGVIAAGFFLLPMLGLTGSTRIAAIANILIGTVARLVLPAIQSVRAQKAEKSADEARAETTSHVPISASVRWIVLGAFAVSGFAAMVYQITWTRALIMSLGSSTYSFTCILAAFILGLALGSLAIARFVDRWRNPAAVFGMFELGIGLVAVLIVPIYGWVPYTAESLIKNFSDDYSSLLRMQFLLIIAITAVPTLMMGAIFPLVTRALAQADDDAAAATGRAYAVNTIGTITGSFLAGFVLIRSDVLGVQHSIVLASVLNGVVGAALVLAARRPGAKFFGPRAITALVALVLIPAFGFWWGQWDKSLMNSAPYLGRQTIAQYLKNSKVLFYAEGVDVTAAVMNTAPQNPDAITITINGKPDASTGAPIDMTNNLLLGHMPALLNPGGKDACVIGLGSGLTVAALSCYPALERIDCVEMSDEVIDAAKFFAPYTYDVINSDARVHMIRGDGRNHLLLTDQKYDVIASEPPNPWLAGVANLFTREYFELGREHLKEGGLMSVWLQGYSVSAEDFRMVIHTLYEVFDWVSLWEFTDVDYMLVAGMGPPRINWSDFEQQFWLPSVQMDLYRVGIRSEAQVLGRLIAAGDALREWSADAPVHTDDNARLEFSTPRTLYQRKDLTLVKQFIELQTDEVVGQLFTGDGAFVPANVRVGVERAVAARKLRSAAKALISQGKRVDAARLLVNAYHLTPNDYYLWVYLIEAPESLRRHGAQSTEAQQIVTEIGRLLAPFTTSARGEPTSQIAQQLRARAKECAQRQLIAQAVADLLDARRLAPEEGPDAFAVQLAGFLRQRGAAAAEQNSYERAVADIRTAIELVPEDCTNRLALADLLAHSGQVGAAQAELKQLPESGCPEVLADYTRGVVAAAAKDFDAAFEHLGAALKSGQIPAKQLQIDPIFEPLRQDARFEALINTSVPEPSTQPAAQPTP